MPIGRDSGPVRDLVHLTSAESRRVPWRNGGGVTEELAVWPAGATFERGDFDARISKASVATAGPFSEFAGFDRVLVVTGGEGLVLDHGGRAPTATVRRLAPYAFAGEWTTSATLLGGAVTDFNVIVRRGRVGAEVRVLDLTRADDVSESLGAGDAFVHVLAGDVAAYAPGAAAPLVLTRGDSLRLGAGRRSDALELVRTAGDPSGACIALLVRLTPAP